MSLYGMMRTGVSGMAAQSTRLGTVADNIANSGTNGYKRASVEFSSLVIPNTGSSYTSGGVSTQVRYAISQEGVHQYTTSATDLAIKGDGFFVVQDVNGQPFLTRAGSFVKDAEGRLVNAAGFYLMGYSYENGVPSPVANGYAGLEAVQVSGNSLEAEATTYGKFSANLPYGAETVTSGVNTPSSNAANAVYTEKTSLVVYDKVGQEVLLDIFFTKTGTDEWEMTVFHQPDASATTSFPYAQPAIENITLQFDSDGKLVSPESLDIDLTSLNGEIIELDLASMTHLATDYTLLEATRNGNGPSAIDEILIGSDGNIYAKYENGTTKALYQLPLATVQSPDQLQVLAGNVFAAGLDSGNVQIGFAGTGGLGAIISGAVENSNVDIAEELTSMIESQRNYTANSKVFQTGSDLMDVLVNLKR